MNIRIAGLLRPYHHAAIARAKSRPADTRCVEVFADCIIKYYGGVATIIPMPATYNVLARLPAPTPYRGIKIAEIPPSAQQYPHMVTVATSIENGSSQVTDFMVEGVSYGTMNGGFSMRITEGMYEGYPNTTNVITYSNHRVEWNVYNGSYQRSYPYGADVNNLIITAIKDQPGYIAAQAAIDANPDTSYKTQVMTTDGVVLAEERQVRDSEAGTIQYRPRNMTWNGAGYVELYDEGGYAVYHHDLSFAVPEDCISPPCPVAPPYSGTDGRGVVWAENWAVAQTALKARRKAFFLKDSTTFLTALADGGHVLSGAMDYVLKNTAPFSYKTDRKYPIGVTYTDAVLLDEITGHPGTMFATKVEERTAVFSTYDKDGTQLVSNIVGTRVTERTRHNNAEGQAVLYSTRITYDKWYSSPTEGSPVDLPNPLLPAQFLNNGSGKGMGLLWSGVRQHGSAATSAYGLPSITPEYQSLTPPYPLESCSVIGRASPQIIAARVATPPIPSGLNQPSFNDSALMPGQSVTLILFGPDGKGVFGEWEEGDTRLHIHGMATFAYDYPSGSFTQQSWRATSLKASLEGLPFPTVNSVLQYKNPYWASVASSAHTINSNIKPPPSGVPDTRTNDDKLLYVVLNAVANL
jgi:hypothetical protein